MVSVRRSIRLPIPEVLLLDTMVTAAGRLAWHGVGPARAVGDLGRTRDDERRRR
jgi:hypothetical protein